MLKEILKKIFEEILRKILEKPLKKWGEKLAHYEGELIKNADPGKKYQLQEEIKECKQKIKELQNLSFLEETIPDLSPLTNLLYLASILLILTSLIVVLIKVIPLEAKFSRDVYKALEEFENAQNQQEEEKKIEEAKALLSLMEAGTGINKWFKKESTVYVLQKIITQVNGSQNEKECKLSSEPLWAVDVNENQIATGGWTRKVYVWDFKKEQCVDEKQYSWQAEDIITGIRFDPKGEKLAVSAGVNVDILRQKAPKSKEWISDNNTSSISFLVINIRFIQFINNSYSYTKSIYAIRIFIFLFFNLRHYIFNNSYLFVVEIRAIFIGSSKRTQKFDINIKISCGIINSLLH